MDKTGQSYGPPVATAPDPLARRLEDDPDELREVALDSLLSSKMQLVWQHRRTMRRFLGVGLVLSIAAWLLLPRWYDSTVKLMPPDPLSGLMNMMGAMSKDNAGIGLAATLLGAKSNSAMFLGIFASRSVLDPMIDRFELMKQYGTDSRERAEKMLWSNVEVGEDRKTGIITVTVSGRSPKQAQEMAATLVDTVNQVVNRASNSAARREREFLETRLKAVKVELDESAKELSVYASQNVALNIPEQAKATLLAAARLQGELAAAESELAGLEQIYTTNNSRVRMVRARIDELKRQLQSSATTGTGGGMDDTLGQTIRNLPKLGIRWADLYRRSVINEAVYEALTKQYEFPKVQEARDVPQLKLLDAANLPEKKSRPHGSIVIPVGLLLSFLLGSAWIASKDYWERLHPDDERKLYIQRLVAPVRARWGRRQLRVKPAAELPYHDEEN